MFKQEKNLAFTLAELVVVISILAILSTVSFVYFSDNISSTRDTKRLSDIISIEVALNSYKQKKGSFPLPGNSFNILNSGTGVAIQGKLDKNVRLSTLDTLPVDPKTKKSYVFSVTRKKQEFELAATLENEDNPKAVVSGNYKSVSKNVLPSITLAHIGSDIEIQDGTTNGGGSGSENRKKFLFNQVSYNLPYTFKSGGAPYTKGVDFSVLLDKGESYDYWQNNDFSSCLEIYEANKSIGNGEYQYLTGGVLENINCTMSDF